MKRNETFKSMSYDTLLNNAWEIMTGNRDYFDFSIECIIRSTDSQYSEREQNKLFNRAMHELEGLAFIGYLTDERLKEMETAGIYSRFLNNGQYYISVIDIK